jgi:serine/threonine protein phosphatase PrpC
VLLSALNGLEPEKIDAPSGPFPLESGDILLAASDGILSLTARQIEEVLKKYSKKTASEIVRILLDKVAALKVAKQDNATIAVVKI